MKTKLMSKKRPGDIGQVYIAVDFEAIDVDTWWTFGSVVTRFPEGNMLETFQTGCDRSSHVSSDSATSTFWTKHPDAFDANVKLAGKKSVEEAEQSIVEYIQSIKARFNDFFLISDSPAFDVRILDNMLQRHNQPVMSMRKGGEYMQALCTWSYRLAIMQLIGFRSADLPRLHAALGRLPRPVDAVCSDANSGLLLRHTPLYDACMFTAQYFKVKDVVASRRGRGYLNPSAIGWRH